jgi:ABC-2 type transport system ATP-binding protein
MDASIGRGSPAELIDSLGAESLIEFSLEHGTPLTADVLASLPGVVRVNLGESSAALHVRATHESLPALLDVLNRRGLALNDLRTHRPTLEDVFVSLTGRHLRDN